MGAPCAQLGRLRCHVQTRQGVAERLNIPSDAAQAPTVPLTSKLGIIPALRIAKRISAIGNQLELSRSAPRFFPQLLLASARSNCKYVSRMSWRGVHFPPPPPHHVMVALAGQDRRRRGPISTFPSRFRPRGMSQSEPPRWNSRRPRSSRRYCRASVTRCGRSGRGFDGMMPNSAAGRVTLGDTGEGRGRRTGGRGAGEGREQVTGRQGQGSRDRQEGAGRQGRDRGVGAEQGEQSRKGSEEEGR